MKGKTYQHKSIIIFESIDPKLIIKDVRDINDLIGGLESEYIVIYEHNISSDFFDLSTRKLGEMLQKLTNHHIQFAVIGDFSAYSEIFQDFRYESNKHGKYLFVSSLNEVKKRWS